MGKQELEEPEGIKDDHPEVRPVTDSCSKEEEKSKLEVALEMLYDKIDIGIKNRAKKLEEKFRDMLDAKMDLTNFNKCNEETENILRALETERESRKEQKPKMSGEINRLKEEKQTRMKEKENILSALEAERESRKEQKAKMSGEINRLKEEKQTQMKEKENILRALEAERESRKEQKAKMSGEINRLKEEKQTRMKEKENILSALEAERESRKEQKPKMSGEINRLKEEKQTRMKEKENILSALEAERESRKEQKAKMSGEINRLKEEKQTRMKEKENILSALEAERESRKEQKVKMSGEINRLKEEKQTQMKEKENILRALEAEKESRKEQKSKMSDEINRLKEEKEIYLEEKEKILRALEAERESRKEQKAKMIDEINRLKEEKETQMKEKENILRALEAEKESRKEQKSKMSDEINRLKEEKEIYLEEKEKILRELVEGENSKEQRDQTPEERKMNRLKKANKILLEEKQNTILELEVERQHKRDKVSEIHQLKEELYRNEREILRKRVELSFWMTRCLQMEEITENQQTRLIEPKTDLRNNGWRTNKCDKHHSPDELEKKSQEATDQNLEDKFEVESVVCVPEETEAQHNNTSLDQTERLQFLATVKQNHLDHTSNIVQALLTGIQNHLRTIPIKQKNMPLRAHLACHQKRLKMAKGSALQKAVLKLQQCGCMNERPNGKQDQPTGPNEPKKIDVLEKQEPEKDEKRIDFLEEKGKGSICNVKEQGEEYRIMETYYKIETRLTDEFNRLEERMRDMMDAKMETFRLKKEEELQVHPTSFNNLSNEIPADKQGQEKLPSIVQNLQRDF
ncbi:trichohyalin-like [Palaemon carinicauda]|uniref:trichohyalin-like n=1 Tax=Palaemon carinicauda TaxID=392227 RepID=UPI0035B5E85D